ncbi:MAG: hypothetical protein M1338_05895, partial [Patescibacteria group bacterium]|nr:hypothetical protein [Patescibacteria group bacterium]
AILKLHDELIASGGYEMGIAEGEGVLRTTKSLGPKMIEENPPETELPKENVYRQTINNELKEKAFEEENPQEELKESGVDKLYEKITNNQNITKSVRPEKESGELHDGDVIKFE